MSHEELIQTVRTGSKADAEKAARTLKHISEGDRTALYAHRKALLEAAFSAADVRVQWNLTIVLGRLPLRGRDKELGVDLMYERLREASGLNRTFAMQALMDLSEDDPALRKRALPIVHEALASGTPALKARARRLLKQVS